MYSIISLNNSIFAKFEDHKRSEHNEVTQNLNGAKCKCFKNGEILFYFVFSRLFFWIDDIQAIINIEIHFKSVHFDLCLTKTCLGGDWYVLCIGTYDMLCLTWITWSSWLVNHNWSLPRPLIRSLVSSVVTTLIICVVTDIRKDLSDIPISYTFISLCWKLDSFWSRI